MEQGIHHHFHNIANRSTPRRSRDGTRNSSPFSQHSEQVNSKKNGFKASSEEFQAGVYSEKDGRLLLV
jgi:hypothetical protein